MKIRNGFVSNSSSSSFVCDVCGRDASGWDMGLSDADMYKCVEGHTFCTSHTDLVGDKYKNAKKLYIINWIISDNVYNDKYINDPNVKDKTNYIEEKTRNLEMLAKLQDVNTTDDELEEIFEGFEDCEFEYEMPKEFCPICNLSHIREEDAFKYITKKLKMNFEDIKSEMRDNLKFIDEV